ncbi:unnamed protein product [Acanthoscelides obtectus]|uniref:Ephrin RBD domain-containing protein n=1 Tax=Acanthoscelides obtectus TaxID=200917 RepID=A0A9P0Q8Q7_ACAOB|nr:unnamed protein product [Acanthoscelides obtectus]CAK1656043.1 hypothetical protein AOBTE_LOCUS19539 [Acanthoscelides obtectus]
MCCLQCSHRLIFQRCAKPHYPSIFSL